MDRDSRRIQFGGLIRKPYLCDVSGDEWALVAPHLTLFPKGAGRREHPIREVFNDLRYVGKTGAPSRWMPNDDPPWALVYQQAQRSLASSCFGALAADLRAVLRLAGAVQAARRHGIRLEVVNLPRAKKGFLLLPRRCVVERSFAWITRFLCLAKDYERYPATLEGLHTVAFVCTVLKKPFSWCRSRTASSQRNAPRCPPAPAPHAAES